jgi:hypothetical protein
MMRLKCGVRGDWVKALGYITFWRQCFYKLQCPCMYSQDEIYGNFLVPKPLEQSTTKEEHR